MRWLIRTANCPGNPDRYSLRLPAGVADGRGRQNFQDTDT